MTREERAREALANSLTRETCFTTAEHQWVERQAAIKAMLAFADAEAVAMRERAADKAVTCELFDGDKLKNSDPRQTIAAAIRALPVSEK